MVKIIADSTCDLSEELIKKYDISILPLHILLGEEEYEDGKTITPEEIFAWSDAHKTTPKTSAPGLEQALALIRPFVEEEREVRPPPQEGASRLPCTGSAIPYQKRQGSYSIL